MEILTNKQNRDKIESCAGKPADSFRVTEIKQALKNENSVNIFIDGEFEFSLDISQVVDFGIKIGKTFTAKEISEMKSASEFGKLYQSSLEWILSRPHSKKEAIDHLKEKQFKRKMENRKREFNKEKLKNDKELKNRQKELKIKTKILPEISDENVKKVLERLEERGYIDDEKFAKFYLENRNLKKGISEKRLKLELKNKGISEEIIENVFADNPRNEEEEIKKIIAKKQNKYDEKKLINYLVRQGFDYQLSQNLVREKD